MLKIATTCVFLFSLILLQSCLAFVKDGSGSIIGVNGTQLMLYGKPYKFVGTNCYQIATLWGTNAGCGGEFSDEQLDSFFSALPAHSLVRFWAFQGTLGINDNTFELDWTPIDRVFNVCETYGHRLIPSLANQGGTCDNDYYQGPAWYFGGFKEVFNNKTNTNGLGLTPLSYWDYVNQIVPRYKNSSALGMWELINEPGPNTCLGSSIQSYCLNNSSCLNQTYASLALRYFYDNVGNLIHQLDPYHLVESGMLGSGQCGTSGEDYAFVSESDGIDVLSYHDYYGSDPLGGDQWNGIAVRLNQAKQLNKPIIGGESGILAGIDPNSSNECYSYYERGVYYEQKLNYQLGNGSSGLLVWDYSQVNNTDGSCTYNTWIGDPVMNVIQNYKIDIYNNDTELSPSSQRSITSGNFIIILILLWFFRCEF